MSLFKNLFTRHQQTEIAPSMFLNWPGQSGTQYPYQINPIDTPFPPLPANYIYAKQAEDGTWVPVYIAQTRDVHQRLEGHVHMDEAVAQGATHIHVHLSSTGQAARCSEERDLIGLWHPVCNEQAES
jgi:hypothetical protein